MPHTVLGPGVPAVTMTRSLPSWSSGPSGGNNSTKKQITYNLSHEGNETGRVTSDGGAIYRVVREDLATL